MKKLYYPALMLAVITIVLSCQNESKKKNDGYTSATEIESPLKEKVIITSGLNDAEIQEYFHKPELIDDTENGLIQKDWLLALEEVDSEENFWANREKYGFVNDPKDPNKMPIGYGFTKNMLTNNCAVCHTSFVENENTLAIIPGGTNRLAASAYVGAHMALSATVLNPVKFKRFSEKVKGKELTFDEATAFRNEVVEWLNNYVTVHVRGLSGQDFKDYKQFFALNKAGDLMSKFKDQAISKGGHPFIVGRNLWMGEHNFYTKNNAADIPYIFDFDKMDKIHYNGSTNSVLERNIISVLNTFNEPTLTKMLDSDPRALGKAEIVSRKIKAPKWDEALFGKINQEKAAKGKQLYTANCASCHAPNEESIMPMKYYAENEIGTDGAYFDLWREPVINLFGKDTLSYKEALVTALKDFKGKWYEKHNISKEEGDKLDPNPWWDFRTEWIARPLSGVWSTAPYLHNSSVPTLYHLLLPPNERPKTFTGGSWVMDVNYIGNQWDKEPHLNEGTFIFDTSGYGMSNKGHDYGTNITEEERMQLLEYLKTL